MIRLCYYLVVVAAVLVPTDAAIHTRVRRQTDEVPWWLDPTVEPPQLVTNPHPTTNPGPVNRPTPAPIVEVTANNGVINPVVGPFAGTGNIDAPNAFDCVCVPFYQCVEGEINTSGAGLISVRFGPSNNNNTEEVLPLNSACPSFLDVCCHNPKTDITPSLGPAQYQPQCGRRNPNGVTATVPGFTATQAQFGEFPWMAAILQTEYNGTEEVQLYVCGGSLIYPDVVLTAAHCVHSWLNNPQQLMVRLGEWDTLKAYEFYTHQDHSVYRVITNIRYNSASLSNDYAILLLDTPALINPHVDTICLPNEITPYDTDNCIVTGWGKDKFGKAGNFQNILKKIELQIVQFDACQDALRSTRLGKYFRLHNSFTCAGGGSSDACNGDGGSPLVCPVLHNPNEYVQVGIVAWGIGCGEPGVPGVYADVAKAVQWINDELNNLPFSSRV